MDLQTLPQLHDCSGHSTGLQLLAVNTHMHGYMSQPAKVAAPPAAGQTPGEKPLQFLALYNVILANCEVSTGKLLQPAVHVNGRLSLHQVASSVLASCTCTIDVYRSLSTVYPSSFLKPNAVTWLGQKTFLPFTKLLQALPFPVGADTTSMLSQAAAARLTCLQAAVNSNQQRVQAA